MFMPMWTYLKSRVRSEEGAETVEYALVIGLFVLLAVGALLIAGDAVQTLFENIAEWLSVAGGEPALPTPPAS